MRLLNLLLAFVIFSNVTNSQTLKSDKIFTHSEHWNQWDYDLFFKQSNDISMPLLKSPDFNDPNESAYQVTDGLYTQFDEGMNLNMLGGIPELPQKIVRPVQSDPRSNFKRNRPGQNLREHRFLDNKAVPGPERISGRMNINLEEAEIKQKLDSTIQESYMEMIGGWLVEYCRNYTRNDSNRIVEYYTERFNPETRETYTDYKYEYTYDTNQTTRLSYIIYRWDNVKAELLPFEKRMYNYADSQDITMTVYRWNSDLGLWKLSGKEDLLVEGELLQAVKTFTWDTILSDWVNDSKIDFLYDEAGNTLEEKIMGWDRENSIWVNASKSEYAFYNFTNRTLYQKSFWDATKNDWSIEWKYTYNDDGFELEYLHYAWKDGFPEMVLDNHRIFEYNDSNLFVSRLFYNWNRDSMKLFQTRKLEYEYNENMNLTEIYDHRWNIDSMKLLPRDKSEYTYNEKQQNSETCSFRWDIFGSKWDTTSRMDYFYDEAGLRNSSISYYWSSKFYKNLRQEYSYDEEGRSIETITFQWNGNAWYESAKQELTYDEAGRRVKTADFEWNGYEWMSIKKDEEFWDGSIYIGRKVTRWDPELGGWETRIDKFLYTGEGFLRQEDYTRYQIDKSVAYQNRDEYSYNEKGEIDTIYYWYTDEKSGEFRVEEIISLDYNESDQITGYEGSEYEDELNKDLVTDKWKGEIEYNDAGDWIRWTDYYWNEDKNAWIGEYQDLMFYDANGLLIQDLEQDWDTILGWVDYYKMDYTYDENGNQLTYKRYRWITDSSAWIPYEFQECAYDIKNQMVMQKNYWWSQENMLWHEGHRIIFEYDTDGNIILSEDYYWSSVDSLWIPQTKNVFEYDTDGNKILDEWFYWESQNSLWIPDSKIVYSYDTHGNLLSHEYFYYDNSSKAYVHNRKKNYSYDLTYTKEEVLIPWARGAESYMALDGGDWSESAYLKEGMILSIVESQKADDDEFTVWNRETFYYSAAQIILKDVPLHAPQLHLYPNPASTTLNISLGDETVSSFDVKVIDLSGKTMLIRKMGNERTIDISSLNTGIYLIQIKTDEGIFTRKFIKSTR